MDSAARLLSHAARNLFKILLRYSSLFFFCHAQGKTKEAYRKDSKDANKDATKDAKELKDKVEKSEKEKAHPKST